MASYGYIELTLYRTPVLDRTSADVAYAKDIRDKISKGTATDEEKTIFQKQDLKGALNRSDLERVINNMLMIEYYDRLTGTVGALGSILVPKAGLKPGYDPIVEGKSAYSSLVPGQIFYNTFVNPITGQELVMIPFTLQNILTVQQLPDIDYYEELINGGTELSQFKGLRAIREEHQVYSTTPDIPNFPLNTYQKWNDIEQIIDDIFNLWQTDTYWHAGEGLYADNELI